MGGGGGGSAPVVPSGSNVTTAAANSTLARPVPAPSPPPPPPPSPSFYQPQFETAKYFTFIFFGLSIFVIFVFLTFILCHIYRRVRSHLMRNQRQEAAGVPARVDLELGRRPPTAVEPIPIKQGFLFSNPDGGMVAAMLEEEKGEKTSPSERGPKPTAAESRSEPSASGESGLASASWGGHHTPELNALEQSLALEGVHRNREALERLRREQAASREPFHLWL